MNYNLRKSKLHFLSLIFFFIWANSLYAQHKTLRDRIQNTINKIDSARQTVNAATALVVWSKSLIYSAQAFTKVANMNTSEFNKNVNVVKADTGNTNPAKDIPAKQITKPKIVNGKFVNLNWQPIAYFDSSLFPSAILAMATYKQAIPDDQQMLKAIKNPIGFNIVSDKSNIPIKYEIECVDKSFFDKVTGYILYKKDKQFTDNTIDIPWNFKTLANTTTPTSISVHFRLFDEDGNFVDSLKVLTVRSVNDCVRYYKNQDLRFMYAAYVQEDDPKIDDILREALDTKIVTQFVGYQWGPDHVDEQIAAIWRVLHEKGFAYSDITKTSIDNSTDGLYSQVIRTCDNALKTKQANCVDGTVLFASILRKIGIDPCMILVTERDRDHPTQVIGGHCFLGYSLVQGADINKDSSKFFHFLETTKLSDNYIIDKNNKKVLVFSNVKTESQKNQAYIKLFKSAVISGELKFYNEDPDALIDINEKIDITEQRKKISSIPIYN